MGKRLFEFAKELGLSSKDVLERCKKLGHNIPSQLTVVDDKIQSDIRRDLGLADLNSASVSAAPAPASTAARTAAPKTPATTSASPLPVTATRTMVKPAAGLSAPTATYPTLKPTAPKTAPRPAMVPRKSGSGSKPMPSRSGGHGLAAGRPKSVTAVVKEASEEKPKVEEFNADGTPVEPKILTKIKISEGITVSELAQKLNVKPGVLIKELLGPQDIGHHQPEGGHDRRRNPGFRP